MSSGKSSGQARSDIEATGPGSEEASWSSDADVVRSADARTSATILAAARVEMLGFVFDRRRRHAWLDQLDPPAIHDHMAGRRGDSHGPAKMMGDPNAHALKYPPLTLTERRWQGRLR